MCVNLFLGENAVKGELEEVFAPATKVLEGARPVFKARMLRAQAFASEKGRTTRPRLS
jgi:hypothetical protein